MERNTKTTIQELQIGDRFYKCNDKSKTVFEIVAHEVKKTYFQTYRYWVLWVGFADDLNLSDEAKQSAAKPVKGATDVIFLRHKID